MQNSSIDGPGPRPSVRRQRYSIWFVGSVLCLSWYMMLQGLQGGLSGLDTNLPGRKTLIALFASLRLKLGDQVFAEALVGQDGWLEYTGGGNSDSFQNSLRLSAGDILDIQRNLQFLYDWFRNRKVTLVLVVAPNKATIYPERLPDQIQRVGPRSDFDVLAQYLRQNDPPVLVDVRPAMRRAKRQRQLYQQTGTHWNVYGAFVAYREVMNTLTRTHPELAPRSLNDFRIKTTPPSVHDIPLTMGAPGILESGLDLQPKTADHVNWLVYNGDDEPTRVSYTDQGNLPRLLMYMDSFGAGLIPLMAPHFSQATFILYRSGFRDLLSAKEAHVANPDILVLEIAERDLPRLKNWLTAYVLSFK